jgi:V/A-type H+/Na+-transporting ATPase subunit E
MVINVIVKNGISAIANDVIGDVQKEAEAVIIVAENEAKATLKAAKEQADQIYRSIINQATVSAEAEKRKIASVTEVEIRNLLLQTKEDSLDVAFEKALVKLQKFVETQKYRDYLLKLIQSAAERIGQKDLIVQLNPKDKDWLSQDVIAHLSKKCHCELKLSNKTEDFLGGCIIQTENGKIIYDVTLDNRLHELKPVLRVELAKMLFGEAL